MSKKYMAIAALMLCFAAQVSAQTVMVENTGRAAVSNYVPEMGFTVDVNVGYVLGLGDAHNYANATPLPSYHIGLGYFLDKHWRVGLSYQKSYLQEDMGFRTFNNGYYSIYGHAVRNVDFDNVMINGDYTFPVSRCASLCRSVDRNGIGENVHRRGRTFYHGGFEMDVHRRSRSRSAWIFRPPYDGRLSRFHRL